MIRHTLLIALGFLLLITGCRSDGINAPKAPPPTPVATEAAELIRACDCGEPIRNPSRAAIDLAIEITRTNLDHAEITGFKRTCVATEGPSSRLQLDSDQGRIEQTGREFDVAISGPGFFAVKTPAGIRYTRNGNFFQDANRQIVSTAGHPVMPPTFIPQGAMDIVISEDGTIGSRKKDGDIHGFATLRLYRFAHADRLTRDDEGLLIPTTASGEPIEGSPADDDHKFGVIFQTFLEASNVDSIQERDRLQRLLAARTHAENKQSVAEND